MSFSGAIFAAIQYGPDAYGSVRSYLNPGVGMKPSVRAEYVDALNRVLPDGRKKWGPQQMFLFLAAFTRLNEHSPNLVQWWRDKDDIVSLIVRGLTITPEEQESVHHSLVAAMVEVEKTLALVPKFSLAHEQDLALYDMADGSSVLARTDARARIGSALSKAWRTTSALVAKPYVAAKGVRERNALINLLRAIADSLEQGGLSTIDVHDILLEQGLTEELVDSALLKRPEE